MYTEPTYPTFRFVLRYGRVLSALVAVAPLVAVLAWTWPNVSVLPIVGAIAAGLLGGLLMQSYVEVLRIIADTLLPR